jgi:antitoxin PrlF
MPTTLTIKGQVTISKQMSDALRLVPGCSVDFAINREGDVVLHMVGSRPPPRSARPVRSGTRQGPCQMANR